MGSLFKQFQRGCSHVLGGYRVVQLVTGRLASTFKAPGSLDFRPKVFHLKYPPAAIIAALSVQNARSGRYTFDPGGLRMLLKSSSQTAIRGHAAAHHNRFELMRFGRIESFLHQNVHHSFLKRRAKISRHAGWPASIREWAFNIIGNGRFQSAERKIPGARAARRAEMLRHPDFRFASAYRLMGLREMEDSGDWPLYRTLRRPHHRVFRPSVS